MAIHEQAQQALWQYTASPAMDEIQFLQWVALLESRTGITLPDTRKTFLQTNLVTRMRELGCGSFQDYYELVTDGSRGNVEWEILVDRLTVHETRFFRDSHALNLISDLYLEPLVQQHRNSPYTLNAWSVGCATGEEPYSLAMLMAHAFRNSDGLYYGVTASDVSRAALQTGRNAVYHLRRVSNVPAEITDRYLQKIDEQHVQVSDELRQKVCFTQVNLLHLEQQPVSDMDIILCQNVLIYFKHELRVRMLAHLVTKLKPGGILVLGAGEIFSWAHPDLEVINYESTLAFRRKNISGSAV